MSSLMHSLDSSVPSPPSSAASPLAAGQTEARTQPPIVETITFFSEAGENGCRVECETRVKVTFTGLIRVLERCRDMAKLAANFAAADGHGPSSAGPTLPTQQALDAETIRLHHLICQAVGYPPANSSDKHSAPAHAVAASPVSGGSEPGWADVKAVVIGKLDSLDGRLAQVSRQYGDTKEALYKLERAQLDAIKDLAGRLDKHDKMQAKITARPAPVAPVTTIELLVSNLLDEINIEHASMEPVLPYLTALLHRAVDGNEGAAWRRVVDLVVQSGLGSPVRAGSHARLCRDLAHSASAAIVRWSSTSSSYKGFEAVYKLSNSHCLAALASSADKVDATAFLAELFALNVLAKVTAHDMIIQLLIEGTAGATDSAEAALQLLAKVGKKLDVAEDKALVDAHFARLEAVARAGPVLAGRVAEVTGARKAGWA